MIIMHGDYSQIYCALFGSGPILKPVAQMLVFVFKMTLYTAKKTARLVPKEHLVTDPLKRCLT